MQLILISGLSGSGKSVALKALEDYGYFCVDNLPATLIASLIGQLTGNEEKVAISVDARSAATIAGLPAIIETLREQEIDCRAPP